MGIGLYDKCMCTYTYMYPSVSLGIWLLLYVYIHMYIYIIFMYIYCRCIYIVDVWRRSGEEAGTEWSSSVSNRGSNLYHLPSPHTHTHTRRQHGHRSSQVKHSTLHCLFLFSKGGCKRAKYEPFFHPMLGLLLNPWYSLRCSVIHTYEVIALL